MNILVVEDDSTLLTLLSYVLIEAGYHVLTANDGTSCIQMVEQHQPDLILLDVTLPNISGFEVCRMIRRSSDVPIIFLSARSSTEDRVMGLAIGGDDYIAKPFEPLELFARIESVSRRCERDQLVATKTISSGNFVLDQYGQRLLNGSRAIGLTPTEFRLLEYLMANARHVLSPQQIFHSVWQRDDRGDYSLVSSYILRLRNKIELDPATPRHIITVWNAGYKFEPD